MVSKGTHLSTAVIALALSGCTTVTTGNQQAEERAVASLPELPAEFKAAETRIVGQPVGWIGSFRDPVLSRLVAEAQANNKDLVAAASSVQSARALAGVASAALSPQVSVSAGTSNSGILDGGDTSSGSIGAQASWELDLWGRLRSNREGAIRSLEAAEADYLFSQYSIAAAVADAYFLSIEANRQLSVTQSQVSALTEIDRIVNVRFENGIGNAQDVALSRSEVADARNSLEQLKGAKRDSLRALEVLLGRYPAADIEVRQDLPNVPPPPPAGLPSDLLERRPDLIAAERRIAAAIKGVDEAKAAKLPSLSLTGSVGGSSNDLSNILDPSNIAWSAASSLLAPVIDGGRLDSQVDLAEADVEAAVATYAQAALNAFSDVEGALDQSVVLRRRQSELMIAVSQSREALRLANLRFDEGETDLIDVLDIQTRVFTAESNLTTVDRSLLSEYVQLNLALGGSWEGVS